MSRRRAWNPGETLELAEQCKSLNGLGLTVLLIEHKLDVVTTLADTVYVLDHGEVIAHGKPDEVRRNEEVLRVSRPQCAGNDGGCGGNQCCLMAGLDQVLKARSFFSSSPRKGM